MDKNVKDLLDTLVGTANVVGETVVEVTKESAKKLNAKKEAAKLNMEVLRIRANIDGLYHEIGKEAYAAHVAGDEIVAEEHQTKIDALHEEIDAKQEQIVQLNKQIDLLNGGSICPACGRISPAEYDFCPSCGAKLEKPEPAKDSCCCEEEAADAECCCASEKAEDCCCGCEAPAADAPETAECSSCGCDACGSSEETEK